MILLNLVAILLTLMGGLMILSKKSFREIGKELKSIRINKANNNEERAKNYRKKVLEIPDSKLTTLFRNINFALDQFEYMNLPTFIGISVVFGIIGFSAGQLWNNIMVSLILLGTGASIPYALLLYLLSKRNWEKDEKIVIVMGILQAELKKTLDFVSAVTNKLDAIEKMSPLLYKYFKSYADEINLLMPNDKIAPMRELAKKVKFFYFTEYIKMAIQFEEGQSSLVGTMDSLPEIAENYMKRIRAYRERIRNNTTELVTKIVITPLMVGFLKVASKDFYEILTQNILGQLTLAIITITIVVCSILYRKYNAQILKREV